MRANVAHIERIEAVIVALFAARVRAERGLVVVVGHGSRRGSVVRCGSSPFREGYFAYLTLCGATLASTGTSGP